MGKSLSPRLSHNVSSPYPILLGASPLKPQLITVNLKHLQYLLKFVHSIQFLNENGYRFFFFSNEGSPLEPRHIHIRKHGALAKFWIDDKKCLLAENIGFTAKELKEIEVIANKNITKIKGAWNGYFFE